MANGHIIAVIGGKGGVGKSQIAANLAFAFSAENRQKTLLLDFDQKACGDQNLITGIKSKKNINDLSKFVENLDPRSIMTFIGQHKMGVHYIGMPTDPSVAEDIDVDGLGKPLKAIQKIYPLTVIDVGAELNELAIKALEYATMIVIVVTPDLLAVNQSRRLFSELQTMMFPKEMIQIVVNQYQKGHPVTTDTIGRQIGRPVFSIVPKDDQGCIRALSTSNPLLAIAKNSPLSQGVVDIVRRIKQKNLLNQLAKLKKPENVQVKKTDSKLLKLLKH